MKKWSGNGRITDISYPEVQHKARDQYLQALKIIEVNFPKNFLYFERIMSKISKT
jgi:hypothetical protein